jgi:hypothetical protein
MLEELIGRDDDLIKEERRRDLQLLSEAETTD